MGKTTDTQQHNCDIRVGEQTDHTRANHQHCTQRYDHLTGNDQVHTKPTLEQRRQVTTEDTTEVSKQHRHPGEHRDLFQVKAVNFKHEQRDPRVKSTPGRFCQETRQRDTPELTVTQDLTNGHFLRRAHLVLGFLTINNVVAFFIGQMLLVARMFIENQPCHCPDKAQCTGDDKCHLPAVHHDCPYHQRRRNHRTNRRTYVKIAYCDGTLFRREPFGAGFQTRRDHRCFRGTDRTTSNSQATPATCQRGCTTEHGPQHSKHCITDFRTQHIQYITCYRLHDRISSRIGCDDIGILLGGDV